MKTILITGSSRGIGRAIAKLAYERGYQVIVHGKTDSDKLNKIHGELKGSIKTFFDISDKNSTQRTISDLLNNNVGSIDVLVNNAGIAKNFISKIEDVDDELALLEYRVNVLGTIHVIQGVIPNMVKQKSGSIINIASIKGFYQLATMSTFTFAMTKSAIASMTRSLAKIYSPLGIRVNAVSPGYTKTDQVNDWNDETFNRINNGTLLGRMADPEEIAPLVMYLASDESSYVTGSEFLIDGGYMLKGK